MLQYVQPITLDVAGGNVYKYVYAKQGDSGSRYVCATILANGKTVDISGDLTAEFRAVKKDGKSVINPAVISSDGTITVELTQQTLAVEGTVDADIIIKNSSGDVLSTASFKILVEKAPIGEQIDSATEILGAEELIAEAVEAYMAENPVEAGSSVYIGAVQPTDGTLYWLDTSDSGGVAEEYSITVNLANVSIDNAATSITEGDSYAAALTANEGYTLATATVTMGGVNVTNTAYASGSVYIASVTGDIVVTAAATEIPAATPVYTITNNLLHATSDNAAVSAEENTAYTATLTADTDYTLDGATVTVTMGGANVTAEVYADGVISIPAVTGDVVITVSAAYAPQAPVFELAEPYTGTGGSEYALSYNIVDEDKTFSVEIEFSAYPSNGYVFRAGYGNNSLGIRGQGGYYWNVQSQYYTVEGFGNSSISNKKFILTYGKGSGSLVAYDRDSDGSLRPFTLTKGWETGSNATTGIAPNGTIHELKIYRRVLSGAEIKAYLGVE